MIFDLQTAFNILEQSKHNIFERNHLFMKFPRKSVIHSSWACLPNKASTQETRETESVYQLHSMVNKNDLQHLNLVSSAEDYHKSSESAVRDCSLLKRKMF
jgi:hypothetical protein